METRKIYRIIPIIKYSIIGKKVLMTSMLYLNLIRYMMIMKKRFYKTLWSKRIEYNKIRHSMFETWMYGSITLFNRKGRANILEIQFEVFYITLMKLYDHYDVHSDAINYIKNYKKITNKNKNLKPYISVFKWIKELINKNWDIQKYKNYKYHNPLTFKRSDNSIKIDKWDHEKYPLLYQKN